MGRWTQYDEDEYRLPEGMTRIGYDSDLGRYFFRDSVGTIWKGPEGSEFGEMTRVSELPSSLSSSSTGRTQDEVESAPTHTRPGEYQLLTADPTYTMAHKINVNSGAYRTLFPFFLIIAVVLLLVWRLIVSPGLAVPPKRCVEGAKLYWAQPGDNCWEISKTHGCSFEKFKDLNPKLECEPLMPGASVCLPIPDAA